VSIKMLELAFKTRIGQPEKGVLIALADRADDGGRCWPSVADLVARSGWAERTVQAALTRLDASGLVRIERATGKNSTYHLFLAEPSTPAPHAGVASDEPPQDVHPTPAGAAPPPPQDVRGTPAGAAPEPSITVSTTVREPSCGARATNGSAGLFAEEAAEGTTSRRARGKARTSVPPDWFPDEAGVAFARSRGIMDIADQVQAMKDWHASSGKLTADVGASWRTWCTKAQQFALRDQQRQHQAPPGARPGRRAWIAAELGLTANNPPDDFSGHTIDGEIA